MLLIPNQKFCTRHIQIAKHSLKNIRTDSVVRMSMNAERNPITITPSDLGRSDTKALLGKILD